MPNAVTRNVGSAYAAARMFGPIGKERVLTKEAIEAQGDFKRTFYEMFGADWINLKSGSRLGNASLLKWENEPSGWGS